MASRLLDLQPVSRSARQAFLEGRGAERIPTPLRTCWERVADAVDPLQPDYDHVVVQADMARRREALEPWLRHLPDALDSVRHEFVRRHHVLVFADTDGVLLHRQGRGWMAEMADQARVVAGSTWAENRKGTNAIGTAVVEQRPVAVHAGAHYARCYHPFTCYAAPVFDLRGQILGVLDATSVADRRESLGWLAVLAATQRLERLVRNALAPSSRLPSLEVVERLLGRFPGPAALFGPRGNVRVASPSSTATQPLRNLRGSWDRIREAVANGASSIDQEGGGTLHLEPFLDDEGELLEVAVFWDTDRPTRAAPPVDVRPPDAFGAFRGSDLATQGVIERARKLAVTDLPVSLLSETGTGKELLAGAIHATSRRSGGPFVPVNCAAFAPGVMESELFGYAPGAFTGAATGGRDGWLAKADGGTLFLDEVAELPAALQSALLRFLDSGCYHRVGEQRLRRADVRIVAATSRDLDALVADGTVRADLYYRICAAVLRLPPLRARTDLVSFAERLLTEVCDEAKVRRVSLSQSAAAAIQRCGWPGNVRQLRYALMHAVALCGDDDVGEAHLPDTVWGRSDDPEPSSLPPPPPSRAEASRRALEGALRKAGGNIAAAARTLGVARSTVYRMMRRHGIDRLEASPQV